MSGSRWSIRGRLGTASERLAHAPRNLAMSNIKTVHIRIEGRVQGVFYRAWTQSTALSLGLTGWVRNRQDRSVEAIFQGPSEVVDNMLRRCEQGPPDAQVTKVEIIGEGADVYNDFEVRGTA